MFLTANSIGKIMGKMKKKLKTSKVKKANVFFQFFLEYLDLSSPVFFFSRSN